MQRRLAVWLLCPLALMLGVADCPQTRQAGPNDVESVGGFVPASVIPAPGQGFSAFDADRRTINIGSAPESCESFNPELIPLECLCGGNELSGGEVCVTFRGTLPVNPALFTQSVSLVDFTNPEEPVFVGFMRDDGQTGDVLQGDNEFTIQVKVPAEEPALLTFVATASYQGGFETVKSAPLTLSIEEPPFIEPGGEGDPAADPDGNLAVSSDVVTQFTAGQSLADIQAQLPTISQQLAVSLGVPDPVPVQVSSFFASSSLATLRFDPTIVSGSGALATAQSVVASNPMVQNTGSNVFVFPAAAHDYDAVAGETAAKTSGRAALDLARIPQAWDVAEANVSAVTVGAVDWPVDCSTTSSAVIAGFGALPCNAGANSHGEFTQVSLNLAGQDLINDTVIFNNTANNLVDHGTLVSGVIGANDQQASANQNMNGVLSGAFPAAGGSPAFTLQHYAMAPASGGAAIDRLASGLSTLVGLSPAPRVINISLGLCNVNPASPSAVSIANTIANNPQILFVAAAGNTATGCTDADDFFPANVAAANLITVGAVNSAGNLVPGTNPTPGIDLAAPGVDVYGPRGRGAGGGYAALVAGTSGAAAMVSGVAGIVSAIDPGLNGAAIKQVLLDTAKSQTPGGSAIAANASGLILDAEAAVRRALPVTADVVFLVDRTGSFDNDIGQFQTQASSIVSTLASTAPFDNPQALRFGVAIFDDYPIDPFGAPALMDVAYDLVLPLTPAQSGFTSILNAINGLSTVPGKGADGPESQLAALLQLANGGAGQSLSFFDNSPLGAASIPADSAGDVQDPGFDPAATARIVAVWTDADFHQTGGGPDGGPPPPFYPGPSFPQTCTALNNAGIETIGIDAGGGATADLLTLTGPTCTDSQVPAGANPVDCGVGSGVVLNPGDPLVCPISNDGTGIADAIIATVESLL